MSEQLTMVKLENSLLTNKYTTIYHEEDFLYNAPHHFHVRDSKTNELLALVHFQEGPIKEAGINGIHNEDLLAMVLKRLSCFQRSEYACLENQSAMIHVQAALLWLRARTMERETRGVEGTHKV